MRSVALLIVVIIATFAVSYIGIYFVRRWALREKVLDIPDERSSHVYPTPIGGGVVIFTTTTLIMILVWLFRPIWPRWWLVWSHTAFLFFLIGSILVAVISWLDDLRSLSIWVRFLFHCLGAVLAIYVFGYWHRVSFPLVGEVSLGYLGLPITFLWIVGLTNAYNFMDGIDGIAGGQAVVAGFGWAIIGAVGGMPLLSGLGGVLGISCLGFLLHNWHPARIFMGDVGSAFLGYNFAVFPVIASQSDPGYWALFPDLNYVMIGILLVWPFVFDSFFTFLRRLFHGENVIKPHRSHLYQRLVISGHSHRTVASAYIALDLLGLVLALLMVMDKPWMDLTIIIALGVAFLYLWGFTVYSESVVSSAKKSA